jgi:hypothetical protein
VRPSQRLLHRRVTGSRQIHDRAVPCFHFASGFRVTQQLACMLNSLVRVSRRVRWAAVYSPPNLQCTTLKVFASQSQRTEPVLRPSSIALQKSAKPNAYAGTCRLDRLTNKRATTRRETPTPERVRLHNASQADAKRQRRRRTNNESASAAATC